MNELEKAPVPEAVSVYIMGKRYIVPSTLTIQKAMEFAGYKLIRGCGCRGGVCGACGTVFRYPGSYKIEVGLACQTLVQHEMIIAQIPFYPAPKPPYDLDNLEPTNDAIASIYPEILKCMGCNTCTKSCPMDIQVMEYISACIKGDIARAAELSFDCVMCGLCTSRCPADLRQYHIAELARRLCGRYIEKKSVHLEDQVKKIISGYFEKDIQALINTDEKDLRKLYINREVEPNETPDSWKPASVEHL